MFSTGIRHQRACGNSSPVDIHGSGSKTYLTRSTADKDPAFSRSFNQRTSGDAFQTVFLLQSDPLVIVLQANNIQISVCHVQF